MAQSSGGWQGHPMRNQSSHADSNGDDSQFYPLNLQPGQSYAAAANNYISQNPNSNAGQYYDTRNIEPGNSYGVFHSENSYAPESYSNANNFSVVPEQRFQAQSNNYLYGQQYTNALHQPTPSRPISNSQIIPQDMGVYQQPAQAQSQAQYANGRTSQGQENNMYFTNPDHSTTPMRQMSNINLSNDQSAFISNPSHPTQQFQDSQYGGNGHHSPYPAISPASFMNLNGSGGRNSVSGHQAIYSGQPHHQAQFQPTSYQMPEPQRLDQQSTADPQLPTRQVSSQPMSAQQMSYHQQLQYQHPPHEQMQKQQMSTQPMSTSQMSTPQVQKTTPVVNQHLHGVTPTMQLPATPPSNLYDPPSIKQENLIWMKPEGFDCIEIANPPPTARTGAFAGQMTFMPAHQDVRSVLQPSLRHPSEIANDIGKLRDALKDPSLNPAAKASIQSRIDQLNNELVILENPTEPKIKASIKRKTDPNKKPRSSNDGTSDQKPTDILARKISENKRPTGLFEAVEYDVIRILWRDPKRPEPSQEAVQKNVTAFGNYVTDLWSKSKKLKADMEEALAKNNHAKSESLRADMESKYRSIRAAIEAALKFGEKFTVSQLGIHMRLLGGLFVMLRNFFQTGDYNGPLPKAIMRLASLFVTVDTEFLKDKVKFDRVVSKYKNELDAEARAYLDQIFDNAKKRSSLKTQDARGDVKNEDVKKPQTGVSKKPPTASAKDSPTVSKAPPPKKDALLKKPATEIKRMQPTDYSGLGSARKVAKRPGDEDVDSRAPKKTALENATGAPVAKPQPQPSSTSTSVPPPPVNPQARARPSGSMLPGRSRVPAKPLPKKPAPQVSSIASSTIGNILDQISKPKEKPKQYEEPVRAPETPEETARRLRKESRRHLRVAWKPDHLLTEVKIFEHDTAEDKGRDQNMLRDARDNRSEGQMLKQRVRDEDDDDDGSPEEVDVREWSPLTLSPPTIAPETRAKNYVTRGGIRPVESEQSKVMDEHESRELMAIYTSLSEIPETPRSPSHKVGEEIQQRRIHVLPSTPSKWQESLPSNTPKRVEIHRRWTEHQHLNNPLALQMALQRCHSVNPQNNPPAVTHLTNHATAPSRPRTAEEFTAETLSLLKSDKVKNYVDPEPYDPNHPKTQRRSDYENPEVQRDADALEDLFEKFKGLPFPATEPPMHIRSNPERVAEWNAGRDRDAAAKAAQIQPPAQPQPQNQYDISHILQQVHALTNPTPAPAPVVAPTPQDLQAVLATLAAGAAPQAPAPPQQNDLAAWMASWAQAQAQAQNLAAQYGAPYGNLLESSKAQPPPAYVPSQSYGGASQGGLNYDDYPSYPEPQDTQNQRDYTERNNRKDNHRGAPPNKDHNKGINRSLINTKPCTFWAKGQCAKGDKCTFRHDPNDLK